MLPYVFRQKTVFSVTYCIAGELIAYYQYIGDIMQIKKIRAIAIIVIVFTVSLANSCFGQTYWKKQYGGSTSAYFASIRPFSDGYFFLTGYTISNNIGDYAGLLIKIKPNGDTIWTKYYDGSLRDWFYDIHATSDGNFLIVGETNSYGNGGYEGWILKIRPNGDSLWMNTYGEMKYDEFHTIQSTNDGNFLITGYTESFGAGGGDGWLIKINPDGGTIWMKTYGGTSLDNIYTIKPTIDGDYLIAGCTGGFENRNGLLVKIASDGDTIWTKTYGGAKNDILYSIQSTIDNNYLIAGVTDSYGWLVKINSNGDTIWTKTFSGKNNSMFFEIQPANDGNFLIRGLMESNETENSGGWLVKINCNGDTIWTKTFSSAPSDYFNKLVPTADGNFLILSNSYSFDSGNYNGLILCLIADQYAYKNSLFTFKIPTYDVDSLNCGYSPIKVPSGMTVSTGGTVSWTPKTDSVYMDHAEFLVINDAGRKDTLSFNIFVNSDYHAPVIKKPSQTLKTASKPFGIITTSLSGKVKFSLPSSASSLCIYDITGRMVDRIVPIISGSGAYAVWPGDPSNRSRIHPGKYFAKALMGKSCAVKAFLFYH
jgi:hypothetical protein